MPNGIKAILLAKSIFDSVFIVVCQVSYFLMNSSLRLNRCCNLKRKSQRGCIQSKKGKAKMNFRSFKAMEVFRKTIIWMRKRSIHNKEAMPMVIHACAKMPYAMQAMMQARNNNREQVSKPIR